ncbi:MAG: GNAT family N-acetyltransferase [bacterium]|nr:GNAT family N-acetyltransferase [bacterium]
MIGGAEGMIETPAKNNASMQATVITSPAELLKLEREWNDLLSRSDNRQPFATFEWAASWLEIFGHEIELATIVVTAHGKTVAIAPFCIRSGKLLTFVGYPQNDYADILYDPACPESLDLVIEKLLSLRGTWSKVLLDQMRGENSAYSLLVKLLTRLNLPYRVEPSDTCPAMIISDKAEAKKMYHKRNITSYINWFQKEGTFGFNRYTDTTDALSRLDDLFAQHVDRWDGTPTPSYFRFDPMKNFYRSFFKRMHPQGWVHFSSLTLDDKYVAIYVSLEFEKKLYLYKTCFNKEYYKKSPGQVILRYLMDDALQRDLVELDFARGDEGYKDRYANAVRQNYRVIIYGGRISERIASAFFAARYSKLATLLFRNKTAKSVKSWLLSKVKG